MTGTRRPSTAGDADETPRAGGRACAVASLTTESCCPAAELDAHRRLRSRISICRRVPRRWHAGPIVGDDRRRRRLHGDDRRRRQPFVNVDQPSRGVSTELTRQLSGPASNIDRTVPRRQCTPACPLLLLSVRPSLYRRRPPARLSTNGHVLHSQVVTSAGDPFSATSGISYFFRPNASPPTRLSGGCKLSQLR